jgi:hypothetical protein
MGCGFLGVQRQSVFALINQFVFGNPGHHRAQLAAHLFDRMGVKSQYCCKFSSTDRAVFL